jgi:hypothetical protein
MANGARQEKLFQLNFLDGAMDGFREDFETHAYVEGLTPEQIETLEKGRDIAEVMFEDILGVVNNLCTSKRAVRNQDG